jgi:hypothetical protein
MEIHLVEREFIEGAVGISMTEELLQLLELVLSKTRGIPLTGVPEKTGEVPVPWGKGYYPLGDVDQI